MKVQNIPILGKFLVILGVLGVCILGATAFSTSKMRFIDDSYSDLKDHQATAATLMARANRSLTGLRAGIAEVLVALSDADNDRALADIKDSRDDIVKLTDSAGAAAPAHATEYTELRNATLKAVDDACADAIRFGKANDNAKGAEAYMRNCAPVFVGLTAKFAKVATDINDESNKINDSLTGVTNGTIHTTWAMMIGGLIVIVTGSIFAIRAWVSAPIKALASTMGTLAGGDLTASVAGLDRRDEIGLMSKAVQVFKDNGLKARETEREAVAARQTAADTEARNKAEQAQRAADQAKVVEALADGLERLSDGDLLFRVDKTFTQDYEKLRGDFNGAMAKLQDTMKIVAGNTTGIRTGSSEISSAADDLARRTERQAASLEETASALNEITATVRKTSEGANHARTVVHAAKEGAENSSAIVRRAVAAMGTIEQSSNQIAQIISVIDEIAFQTNLLALNAGVEAARAGEAGRGFAVVASEVRALAQRCAEAAKEIKALISASSQQVADGVHLVDETGKALGKIALQVAEITGIVGEIASSTTEQATALSQVNIAIVEMDKVTQQNAAMVEESTAASRNLFQETEDLARVVGSFKIGETRSKGSFEHKPAASQSAAPVRHSAPAMKTVSRGGGAARAPAASSEDWTEF